MSTQPKDDLDRVIDETLASMIAAEPRRVNAASVRQAMGESRSSRLPVWFAAAAALIVGLGVVLKAPAPADKAPAVAQSSPSRLPVEVPSEPSASPIPAATVVRARASQPARILIAAEGEEGLPRLAIDTIEVPEPLSTTRLPAEPIWIPSIEIAPISISTLSTEQEHNQEPSR